MKPWYVVRVERTDWYTGDPTDVLYGPFRHARAEQVRASIMRRLQRRARALGGLRAPLEATADDVSFSDARLNQFTVTVERLRRSGDFALDEWTVESEPTDEERHAIEDEERVE